MSKHIPHMDEIQLGLFAAKVDKRSYDECWEWLAYKNSKGYGSFKINRKTFLAHRVSWRIFFGEIPEGMNVLHKCNNSSCVNPYHLYLGDQSDNMADRRRDGYVYDSSIKCKFYDEDIQRIKRLLNSGTTRTEVAKMFGVSRVIIGIIGRSTNYPSKGSWAEK